MRPSGHIEYRIRATGPLADRNSLYPAKDLDKATKSARERNERSGTPYDDLTKPWVVEARYVGLWVREETGGQGTLL